MTANDLPREHVERDPLPWREVTLTECGLAVADLKHVITRAEFEKKIASQGSQRAAFTTCMTCWSTSGRWRDSIYRGSALMVALRRELDRGGSESLERDMYAVTALIKAHREEFDAYVAGLEQTVDLSARRRSARRRST